QRVLPTVKEHIRHVHHESTIGVFSFKHLIERLQQPGAHFLFLARSFVCRQARSLGGILRSLRLGERCGTGCVGLRLLLLGFCLGRLCRFAIRLGQRGSSCVLFGLSLSVGLGFGIR